MHAIIKALPESTGDDQPSRLRWVGIQSMPYLVEVFPDFFVDLDLFGFLPTLNHIIHQKCESSIREPTRRISSSTAKRTR